MDNRGAQVDVESLARWRRSTSSRSGNAAATASTLILSGQLVYGNCADWMNLIFDRGRVDSSPASKSS